MLLICVSGLKNLSVENWKSKKEKTKKESNNSFKIFASNLLFKTKGERNEFGTR